MGIYLQTIVPFLARGWWVGDVASCSGSAWQQSAIYCNAHAAKEVSSGSAPGASSAAEGAAEVRISGVDLCWAGVHHRHSKVRRKHQPEVACRAQLARLDALRERMESMGLGCTDDGGDEPELLLRAPASSAKPSSGCARHSGLLWSLLPCLAAGCHL